MYIMPSKIAIQGEAASFHDIAAAQFFPSDSTRLYADSFPMAFQAVDTGEADYALVAIENTLFGPINEVYDLLLKSKSSIFGEVSLRVNQCLIAHPGTSLGDIKTVYSHAVALAQCEEYLETKLAGTERVEHHDTAASVELVSQLGDTTAAAIASRAAADLHGMKVIAEDIETDKENYTRFVALSKSASDIPADADKTSLVIVTNHTPHAIYDAIGCFATRDINMTLLHSRRIIGDPWHYSFYVDVATGMQDPVFEYACEDLQRQGNRLTILGSYVSSKAV